VLFRSALLKNPKIQQRLKELHAVNMSRNMITVDKVLADLEHDKLAARKNKQNGAAIRATELQGKYLAMFRDRIVNEDDAETMTERERVEAKRIAKLAVDDITPKLKIAAG